MMWREAFYHVEAHLFWVEMNVYNVGMADHAAGTDYLLAWSDIVKLVLPCG